MASGPNALSSGATATCFYLSLAAAVGAAVTCARRAVERRPVPRAAIVLAGLAVLGFGIAVTGYVTGSRDVLPF